MYIHWVFSVGDAGNCESSLEPCRNIGSDENNQVD